MVVEKVLFITRCREQKHTPWDQWGFSVRQCYKDPIKEFGLWLGNNKRMPIVY